MYNFVDSWIHAFDCAFDSIYIFFLSLRKALLKFNESPHVLNLFLLC